MKNKILDIWNSKAQIVSTIGAVLFFLLFYLLLNSLAYSRSLCCADDSYISVAAKNLANGSGYGTAFFSAGEGIKKYEYGITTGPTLIIPAAWMIKIFGNKPWVPGLTTVWINLILTLIIYYMSYKFLGLLKANIFLIIFLLFSLTFIAPQWTLLWFTILGEVTGALLYLIGIMLFSYKEKNEKYFLASIFILGLSFITKYIYLITIIPFLVYGVGRYYLQPISIKVKIIKSFLTGLVFLSPFLLFEVFKILDIGAIDYFKNLKSVLREYSKMHGSFVNNFNFSRSQTLKTGLGLNLLPILIAILGYALFGFFAKIERSVKILINLTIIGLLFCFLWWFFISKGWIRYGFPWIFNFIILSALIIAEAKNKLLKIFVFVFIVVLVNPIELRGDIKWFKSNYSNLFVQRRLRKNLMLTKHFLKKNMAYAPFVSYIWVTYADIEYILPTSNNFIQFDNTGLDTKGKKIFLVRNLKWVDYYIENKKGIENRIKEFETNFPDTVFYAFPYLITTQHEE